MNDKLIEPVCSRIMTPICIEITKNIPVQICYARNIDFGFFFLFQPATFCILFFSFLITCTIIVFVKRKYTAVGRLEMAHFFYFYLLVLIIEMLLYSNIIKAYSTLYKYISILHISTITALFFVLFFNGFVGFQIIIDGTNLSILLLRITATFVLTIVFCSFFIIEQEIIAISSSLLLVIIFATNFLFVLFYIISQFVLTFYMTENYWALCELLLAVFFLLLSCLSLIFSSDICNITKHYIDGILFCSLFVLLGFMMIYKYWDSITEEDFEFCVDNDQNTWALNFSN